MFFLIASFLNVRTPSTVSKLYCICCIHLTGLSLGQDCPPPFCQRSDVNKDLATVAWMIGGFLRLQKYLFLVLWKLLASPHVFQLVAQCPVGWKSQYLLYLFILKYYMKSGNPYNWVIHQFV